MNIQYKGNKNNQQSIFMISTQCNTISMAKKKKMDNCNIHINRFFQQNRKKNLHYPFFRWLLGEHTYKC